MNNSHIREKIKTAGVYQWQVAEAMGICEMSLIHWLRKPLTGEKERKVLAAIDKLAAQKAQEAAQ